MLFVMLLVVFENVVRMKLSIRSGECVFEFHSSVSTHISELTPKLPDNELG